MAERRISQVMRQRRRGHDRPEIRRVNARQIPTLANRRAHDRPKRPRHARHFQAVCETRAHIIVVRQWKHLRLVLQPAKRRTEDDSVPVALKWRALRLRTGGAFAAEAIGTEKLRPLHIHGCFVAARWMKNWKTISTSS